MDNKLNENLIKFILWKEIFSIPIYTLLFNKLKIVFWIYLIIDRLIVLTIISKSIKIDELLDEAFNNKNSHLLGLSIFSMICSITLYIMIFIKYRKLFYILIICEVADYIVTKLLEK
ncbi:hypothetical protein [Romboutsia lituseburensis]|uniref:hypothetical protein n=1 Tax=Romboutsia lituseburensis TaxID=1537 RepID=UPI00215A63C4|nr:hypothetical protein [Romboutsia lituseburensis]MCR8746520.1 hypothetical protein [Romboutsia lituseburensis]